MSSLPPPNARLLIVEDHPATRAGLVGFLGSQPGFEVCGQTDSWREALQLLKELGPDLVLLDLQLKDGHGWSLLYATSTMSPCPKILVYSVFDEQIHAARLLRAGAAGYLNKDAPLEAVAAAIRKVLAGHLVVSEAMTSEFIRLAVGRKTEPPEAEVERETQELSDRELQVFEMISRGLLNKEIAAQLGIGAKTVGSYKARLMGKLGITNVPDLVRAAKAGLLSVLALGPSATPGGTRPPPTPPASRPPKPPDPSRSSP